MQLFREDLGGDFHLHRCHLQPGTLGARLGHEPGHVCQGRFNRKG